jgi:hypothetical protein
MLLCDVPCYKLHHLSGGRYGRSPLPIDLLCWFTQSPLLKVPTLPSAGPNRPIAWKFPGRTRGGYFIDHPPPPPTHTHFPPTHIHTHTHLASRHTWTLSLSLSLTHTHTHTLPCLSASLPSLSVLTTRHPLTFRWRPPPASLCWQACTGRRPRGGCTGCDRGARQLAGLADPQPDGAAAGRQAHHCCWRCAPISVGSVPPSVEIPTSQVDRLWFRPFMGSATISGGCHPSSHFRPHNLPGAVTECGLATWARCNPV